MITKVVEFLVTSETVRDVIFVTAIVGAVFFFSRAVSSRKYYKCPHCGESFRVELMRASHCKACGAEVNISMDENTSDKTH